MERLSVDVLVIGAGPTGLGAAWRLSALGRANWCLCEAGKAFGGLAGSFVDADGFTWDFGGHVQHSHYGYFDDLMDDLLGRDGWLSHQRESWIFTAGRFVPYPFQLNVHRLPDRERDECLDGLRLARSREQAATPAHFGEWLDATFGRGISRLFMEPYNRKVWAFPLEQMDWRWIGDRVAVADLARILDNAARTRDDTSWGPNHTFRFPKQGGTGSIWRTLGERLAGSHPDAIRLGCRLVEVDTARRLARVEDAVVDYKRLITTVPLDRFVELTDLRTRLAAAASCLQYTSTHLYGVALHGSPTENAAGKSWMYFPDADCPFYRVTVFSRYSPFNVPDASRFWSLLVEESERDAPSQAVRVDRVLEGLLRSGLIESRTQVHHVWYHRLEHGYPVPSLGRDAALGEILGELESRDVYSRGRFGCWKYEVSNQDHSVAQGVEVVDRLVLGTREQTVADHRTVNRPKAPLA